MPIFRFSINKKKTDQAMEGGYDANEMTDGAYTNQPDNSDQL